MQQVEIESQKTNTLIIFKIEELLKKLSGTMGGFFDEKDNKEMSISEVSEIMVTACAHLFNLAVLERVLPEHREDLFEQIRVRMIGPKAVEEVQDEQTE